LQANLCRPSSTAKVDSHPISVRCSADIQSDDAWKRVCLGDCRPCNRPLCSHPSAKRSQHDVVSMLGDMISNGPLHACLTANTFPRFACSQCFCGLCQQTDVLANSCGVHGTSMCC
jgi:hypothetical protein